MAKTVMLEIFSKDLFRNFIDEFVSHSQALKTGKFTIEAIGRKVFPGNAHPKRRMNETYGHRSGRPLDGAVLKTTLEVCRELLLAQLKAISDGSPEDRVKEFEAGVCRKLKLSDAAKASVEDFQLDRRASTELRPEDFGLPDVMGWRDGDFEFANELDATQLHSVRILHTVVD